MYRFNAILNYSKSPRFRIKNNPEIFEEFLGLLKLESTHLPALYDFNHFIDLAVQIRSPLYALAKSGLFSPQELYKYANFASSAYHKFTIPKRGGGVRTIMAPNEVLKEIQRFILCNMLSEETRSASWHDYGWSSQSIPISIYAKAYRKGYGVKDAARFHVRKKMVLCMDIEDFFGSIGYGRVYHMFREFGYNKSVATLLANLCTVNGALPQGTPTSPAISNIICRAMDEQIAKYAKAEEINYTRYADDLTFSGDFDAVSMIREVRQILGAYGFRVNEKKTRVLKHSQQQKVVGVVVNKKMQVPRKERDRFRQEAYYIQKFGMKGRFGGHLRKKKSKLSAEKYLSILIGQVAGALFINPEDEKLKQYREIFRRAAAELRPPF